jgi:hypothetical protein
MIECPWQPSRSGLFALMFHGIIDYHSPGDDLGSAERE